MSGRGDKRTILLLLGVFNDGFNYTVSNDERLLNNELHVEGIRDRLQINPVISLDGLWRTTKFLSVS